MCPNNLYANQSRDRALWNPTGLTARGRAAVSQAAQPMTRFGGAGRLRHNHNKPFVRSGAHFPSTHDRTCGAEEPGSFTAQHEIQGAALEAGPTRALFTVPTRIYSYRNLLWVSATHGNIESSSTQINYLTWLLFHVAVLTSLRCDTCGWAANLKLPAICCA